MNDDIKYLETKSITLSCAVWEYSGDDDDDDDDDLMMMMMIM